MTQVFQTINEAIETQEEAILFTTTLTGEEIQTGEYVGVKEGKMQKFGKVTKINGCNVYVEYAKAGGKFEVGKFHKDSIVKCPQLFWNDVQADNWKKANGFRKATSMRSEMVAVRYSAGNAKLEDTATTTYRQYNITAVKTCPQRTEMCESLCYALKAERQYTDTRRRRKIDLKNSLKDFFVQAMIEQIEHDLEKTDKTILFRIHESGDFYSVEYFEKWVAIVNHFKGNNKIVFYAYTKSMDIITEVLGNEEGYRKINMTLKFSEWDDTKAGELEKARKLGLTKFGAIPVGEKPKDGVLCSASKNAENKTGCGACVFATGGCATREVDTYIEIH